MRGYIVLQYAVRLIMQGLMLYQTVHHVLLFFSKYGMPYHILPYVIVCRMITCYVTVYAHVRKDTVLAYASLCCIAWCYDMLCYVMLHIFSL